MTKKRIPDYASNKNKPLLKDIIHFQSANAIVYGNSTNCKVYHKLKNGEVKKDNHDNNKIYYIAEHMDSEYFAIQILQVLGIKTPHIRLARPPFDAEGPRLLSITEGFPDYLPMIAVRNDCDMQEYEQEYPDNKNNPRLHAIRDQYQLDIQRQLLYDKTNHSYHKIGSHLFAGIMMGILIGDFDFQAGGANLGLIQSGQRFHAYAFDKEQASFEGGLYNEKVPVRSNAFFCTDLLPYSLVESPLFRSATLDQKLAVVYQVSQCLVSDKSGQTIFDKIFLNQRVIQSLQVYSGKGPYTGMFYNKFVPQMCANFIKTAESLIKYYKEKYGADVLSQFIMRDYIRMQIAIKVTSALNVENSKLDEIISNIVEDLRAPYYEHFFTLRDNLTANDLQNEKLINKLIADYKAELLNVPVDIQISDIKRSYSEHRNTDLVATQPREKGNNEDSMVTVPRWR